MSLPRYFVPHAASPSESPRTDPDALVHAVDVFRLRTAHTGEQEWVVCTDMTGDLVALPADAPLPPSLRAQLTHHELASGRTPRRIAANEFFIFSVQLVEHPADAQGVNDPVYLYGTLSGPYPSTTPQRMQGQLTVTRGDVLAGLVHGASEALQYAHDPETRGVPHSHHALLPGDRPERLADGRGLVLAYPAVPPELQTRNAANGSLVATIVHQVLAQLQEHARTRGGSRPLAEMELPVPSRFMAIADLESRGYEVKGDVAVLRRNHPGLVNRIAEWLNAEKVKIPREATPAEFLELARKALDALPGWPSDTERVLRPLVRPGNSASPPASPPPAPMTTQRVIPPRAPSAPARQSDWMQDFLDAHQRPGGSQPKLSRAVRAPPPPPPSAPPSPGTSREEWMKDFGTPPEARPAVKPQGKGAPKNTPKPAPKSTPKSAPKTGAPSAPEPSAKPDWMSDFED